MTRQSTEYQCHPASLWAVEDHGLRLYRTDNQTTAALGYPEAALWDLLSRYRSLPTITDRLAVITGWTGTIVSEWISSQLDVWIEEGWLTACCDGQSDTDI